MISFVFVYLLGKRDVEVDLDIPKDAKKQKKELIQAVQKAPPKKNKKKKKKKVGSFFHQAIFFIIFFSQLENIGLKYIFILTLKSNLLIKKKTE